LSLRSNVRGGTVHFNLKGQPAATPALIKLFAVITQYRGKIGTPE
jgi:hypothetical protein